jgi:hypothetical protein
MCIAGTIKPFNLQLRFASLFDDEGFLSTAWVWNHSQCQDIVCMKGIGELDEQ